MATPVPKPVQRRIRTWHLIRFVVGIALGALALWALNGQRNELLGASAALGRLHVGWLILAIAAEFGSFASFGALQARLMTAGGIGLGYGYATVLSLAAGAIADSVPAGPAFASLFAYRMYRRKGADEALAGWTLLATLMCAALALAMLASAGVGIASSQSSSYDLVGVIIGILVLSVAADAVVLQRRWLAHVLILVLQVSRRIIGHPKREGFEIVEELLGRLSAVRLHWQDLLATMLFGIGDWVFDCGALGCGFLAVGAPLPWRGLLLAYGAGQLAANLPVTPGGLGVVEGSMTIALVAFGGSETSTVAAVLCYRIVSFWGYLPVGWTSWAVLTLVHRRQDRAAVANGRLVVGLDSAAGGRGGVLAGGTAGREASGAEGRAG